MVHGGHTGRRPVGRRPNGLKVDNKKGKKKFKSVSVKNQIRSTQRMLDRKNLPSEIREAQESKLEELKKQLELQSRLAKERKRQFREKRIKFFERRKIERMIRRLEKQQRTSSDENISNQLAQLKGDLEYVRFFPKTEKYVRLFVGGDGPAVVEKRNKLREQIKANLAAAAASGKDLEETASDDDALDISGDEFFLSGSSSDEAEADDEWTDKSAREPASSASGKVTSGVSSDEKDQRQASARLLMPPPRAHLSNKNRPNSCTNPSNIKNKHPMSNFKGSRNDRSSNINVKDKPTVSNFNGSSTSSNVRKDLSSTFRVSFNPLNVRSKQQVPNFNGSSNSSNVRNNRTYNFNGSFNPSNVRSERSSDFHGTTSSNSRTDQSSNLTSSSDARKPRRKRRPKKKKQA